MALRAAPTLSPFWYAPSGQEGAITRFKIRGLTGLELSDVNADAKPDNENKTVKFGSAAMRTAISAALSGWENFLDADGNPVPFENDNRLANVNLLPFEVLGELFGEILQASRVGAEQAKN